MEKAIAIPEREMAALCRRWHIVELALFGSALRDDFGPDSDVDLLVSFDPGTRVTLLDMECIREELTEMLGRQVDVLERSAVERSRNYIRRSAILKSAEIVYEG